MILDNEFLRHIAYKQSEIATEKTNTKKKVLKKWGVFKNCQKDGNFWYFSG